MRFRSYKNILEEINKRNEIILTISLWTYSSKRMTFNVPFHSIKHCLDSDMLIKGNKNGKVTFTTVKSEQHNYWYDKLRIAKLDSVEIVNF